MRKVISGEPLRIPASTYNAFIDTAEDFFKRRHSTGVPRAGESDDEPVLVQNSSGSDVDRFGVLGISNVVISPTDNPTGFGNQVAMVGVTPDADDHEGKFLIAQAPIANGALGLCRASGLTWVKVDVSSEGHGYAEVKDGDLTQLASAASGSAQILYKESGTGTKWAVVRFPFRAAAVAERYEVWLGPPATASPLNGIAWLDEDNPTSTGYGDWNVHYESDTGVLSPREAGGHPLRQGLRVRAPHRAHRHRRRGALERVRRGQLHHALRVRRAAGHPGRLRRDHHHLEVGLHGREPDLGDRCRPAVEHLRAGEHLGARLAAHQFRGRSDLAHRRME